jgi:glycosyltransferase involved in cell wall biosynthesis
MADKVNKKIMEVTTFYAPVVGGVETQVEDLSKRLVENGYDVEVLTTTATRDENQQLNETGSYQGIPVTRTKVLFSLSQFHKFAPGFFKLFKEKDFDVIHIHGIRKFEGYLALYWVYEASYSFT